MSAKSTTGTAERPRAASNSASALSGISGGTTTRLLDIRPFAFVETSRFFAGLILAK
jgi:hypothetical protein